MRRWHALLPGGLAALVVGCGEPPYTERALPPGAIVDPVPESEKGDNGPQALGEMAVTKNNTAARETPPPARPTDQGETITTPTGLKYETLEPGSGDEVKSGQTVVMTYVGKLDDGTVFDQAAEGKPFETTIGVGQVIKGWDQGVVGMHVGERRKLIIPPDLGYGERGQGSIPPNARLTFEVKLLKVK